MLLKISVNYSAPLQILATQPNSAQSVSVSNTLCHNWWHYNTDMKDAKYGQAAVAGPARTFPPAQERRLRALPEPGSPAKATVA